MSDSSSETMMSAPGKEETESVVSDGEALADELGQIGAHTVDDDKIKASVVAIQHPSPDTVRLWYRFPLGEGKFLAEDFEKPIPWNLSNSQLARIVEYSGLTKSTFTDLKNEDVSIILKERQNAVGSVDVEDVVKNIPPGIDVESTDGEIPDEFLVAREDNPHKATMFKWRAADPRRHGDLYPHPPEDPTDSHEDTDGFGKEKLTTAAAGILNGLFLSGVLTIVLTISYLVIASLSPALSMSLPGSEAADLYLVIAAVLCAGLGCLRTLQVD